MYQTQGSCSSTRVNVSNNKVDRVSGIFINSEIENSISYCSFSRNEAIGDYGWVCVGFGYNSHQMSYTNIIENSQVSAEYGIIYTVNSAELKLFHCSIFGNCENGSGTVFSSYDAESSIICSDCSFGSNQQTKGELGNYDFGLSADPSFNNSITFLAVTLIFQNLIEFMKDSPVFANIHILFNIQLLCH